MFGLGLGEILIILLFALIFIGPKKLPELAQGLGKFIKEFQKAGQELKAEIMKEHHSNNTTTVANDTNSKSDSETVVVNSSESKADKETPHTT